MRAAGIMLVILAIAVRFVDKADSDLLLMVAQCLVFGNFIERVILKRLAKVKP